MTEHFRVAIVGSGPGGMSAAGRAAQSKLSHVLLEKTDHLSDTIYKYQKGKLVMATPDILPLRSPMDFKLGIREDILGTWDKQTKELGVNLRYNAEVTKITGRKGAFELTVNGKDKVTAEYVVLAIGLQGNLRKLGVPGENDPRIQYQLDDPDEYAEETIVVVGAGDAAIENAVALAKQNKVIMINRSAEFARCKQGNLDLITKSLEKGVLECMYKSSPTKVEAGPRLKFTLKTADGEAVVECDRVIARLGALAPRAFVESCGIQFPSKDPTALPELSAHYESNVPGLYVIGALAGYPLIKQAMNQGYEVVEFIQGNECEPADEPLLKEKFKGALLDRYGSIPGLLAEMQKTVPVFSGLTTLQLREVLLESNVHTPKGGGEIFHRNDYSNTFYTIFAGEVGIEIDPDHPDEMVRLGPGEFFGEMGLLAGRRRSATVRATQDCVLIETSRREMIKLIKSVPKVRDVVDAAAIERQIRSYIAPNLSKDDMAAVLESAKLRSFKANEVIFNEGDPGDGVFLIRTGSCTVSRRIGGREIVMNYVPAGHYVGEMALVRDMPRAATVKAAIETEAVWLDGAGFRMLMDHLPQLRSQIERRIGAIITQTEDISQRPEAGNLIQFLVQEGGKEAADMLLIDEALCVRCDNCEKACAETHGGISRLDREAGPTYATIHVPTSCRHCEHPHCMADCPPDALHKTKDGEVFIDEQTCIGCGNCERNCPYGVIHMAYDPPKKPGLLSWLLFGFGHGPGEDKIASHASHEGKKRAVKCDMCKDIEGGAACVRSCPTGAAIRVHPEQFFALTTHSPQ
ncbi:MAG: cyclic nucleotide-binding domain-containing protein [Alphaproteobacteria bacterium]|nr:cyclic nucleotide-binding domain-containing protein [Alphaproteobacteria bacterium]